MLAEESDNVLLRESRKWKEFKQNTIKLLETYKNEYKQEEETNILLQDKISNLNNTSCDTAQKVKLEMHNKFTATNDIFRLGEYSDQIDNFCCDIENLLESCNELKQRCEGNLDNFQTKLNKRRAINDKQLKVEMDEIRTLMENIKNCSISTDREMKSLELNNLANVQTEILNEMKFLASDDEKLTREICEIEQKMKDINQQEDMFQSGISQEEKLCETILISRKRDEAEINRELTELNDMEETIKKKLEDVQLSIGEYKKTGEEQSNFNGNLFNENVALQYESKYFQEKLMGLQKISNRENEENIQKLVVLQRDIELLKSALCSRETILSKEKDIAENCKNNMEVLNIDIHKLKEKINISNKDIDLLNAEKSNLIALDNTILKTIDLLPKDISKKADRVQVLKSNIYDSKTKISNCTLTHKDAIEKIRKEIEGNKTNIEIRKKHVETTILKQKEFIENSELDELKKFKTAKLKLESDIEFAQRSNEKIKEDIKQLSIKWESKTLECDILSRKIKTASELQISLCEELKPKPVPQDQAFMRKRQIDETSDSSFDGTIPFQKRILMKKKNKKAKTSSLRMSEL